MIRAIILLAAFVGNRGLRAVSALSLPAAARTGLSGAGARLSAARLSRHAGTGPRHSGAGGRPPRKGGVGHRPLRPRFLWLTPQAQATLTAQARWLLQHPFVRASIEGHADERQTRDYALALGERRAAAVRNFLIASGVPPQQLPIISWGKERPTRLPPMTRLASEQPRRHRADAAGILLSTSAAATAAVSVEVQAA